MKLFVKTEMNDLTEPGRQAASQADQPISVQGPGRIYLFMVLQPLYHSLGGPRRSKYVTFALLLLRLLFFVLQSSFLHIMLSKTCQVSPSLQEMKPLTGVGYFILVCNIVYVPMVALYCVYRLLKEEKNMYRLCDQ